MKNHRDERFWVWIFFRIMMTILVVTLIVEIVSGATLQQTFFFHNWFWDIIGLFMLLWFLSWIFTGPRYHGHWGFMHEERILRRRYARGEITETQFKRMMKVLKESQKD